MFSVLISQLKFKQIFYEGSCITKINSLLHFIFDLILSFLMILRLSTRHIISSYQWTDVIVRVQICYIVLCCGDCEACQIYLVTSYSYTLFVYIRDGVKYRYQLMNLYRYKLNLWYLYKVLGINMINIWLYYQCFGIGVNRNDYQ